MHRNKIIRFTIASTSAALLLGLAGAPALAHDGGGGGYDSGSSWSGSYDGGQRGRAASYINPDTGAATANPDVDPGSSCYRPDQSDKQAFSPAGTTTRNVHNDACFLDRDGNKLNGPASQRALGRIRTCAHGSGGRCSIP